jgi:Icc-related predicted phosphoesterase
MIRVLYMSDLHLEMERWRLSVPGWADFMALHRGIARHPSRGPLLHEAGKVDLVVLAGDIHNGLRGVVYAGQVSRYLDAPVVMVAGNHEYYHHDMAALLPALRAAVRKTDGRVTFLENAAVRFTVAGESLCVLGCTLWTDYRLHGDALAAMLYAQRQMNDHNFISLGPLPFTPWDALALHQASLRWLHEALALPERHKTIIVTHHAPSGLVLGARQGAIAPAYGSDIVHQFSARRPDLWIHGHTHYRHDSVINGIRLVSAPRGYVGYDGDNALQFRPGLVEI